MTLENIDRLRGAALNIPPPTELQQFGILGLSDLVNHLIDLERKHNSGEIYTPPVRSLPPVRRPGSGR